MMFILGLFLGSIFAIIIMAILQINRDIKEEPVGKEDEK